MTKAECLLWIELKSKQIEKIRFNRQKPIGNLIIDFYSKELKLAIDIQYLI